MIRLITFATEDFTISAERLKATALRHGVDNVQIITPDYFDHSLLTAIKPLLKDSRGYGWWLWKPWALFIGINLFDMKDGDILIYSDAACEFTDSLHHVLNVMDEDIFFCSNGWQHSHWCKREVAELINGLNDYYPSGIKSYEQYKQVQASFVIFKVNDNTRKFVQEWYAWSIMPGFIDNTPRGPQFPEFQEHRHDQAILTCLQIKYGYKLHWFPSTTGHHVPRGTDPYPEIINHHRKRNSDWK